MNRKRGMIHNGQNRKMRTGYRIDCRIRFEQFRSLNGLGQQRGAIVVKQKREVMLLKRMDLQCQLMQFVGNA